MDNQQSVVKEGLGAVIQPHEQDQDEFLHSWFPDLEKKSYIIPIAHLSHVCCKKETIGNVLTSVFPRIKDKLDYKLQALDETHQTVHSLFNKLKDDKAKEEVMVMMTQASFSMYNSPTQAALPYKGELSRNCIEEQKKKYSELVIVNKKRGVLVGVVESVHFSNPELAKHKLQESVTNLTNAAKIVQEVVKMVPGADKVVVHMALVLPSLNTQQLNWILKDGDSVTKHRRSDKTRKNQLQTFPGVSYLCKDQIKMEDVKLWQEPGNWWEKCWSSGHLDLPIEIYKQLVAKFAIPATRVQIYLTSQPRLQLKHEHEVVKFVGDFHGADVFQAGLHQLSLFPTQAELLDFDYLDDSQDDVKFLWGPPGTGKTVLLVLRALQWVNEFSAQHIVLLQTSDDGTVASYMVQYQLQQTLSVQKCARQSGNNTESARCTFALVNISGQFTKADGHNEVVLEEDAKEKLYKALDLQQCRQSDTAIHILADEADGYVVAAVYQWLRDKGVAIVRLWAAGVEPFPGKEKIPALLKNTVCEVTEPLRCPRPVVEEVMKAKQIEEGKVPMYNQVWPLTGGPAVEELKHFIEGLNEHTKGFYPWRCGQCVKNIVDRLLSLHVGEADKGRQGLSENDVFILGYNMDCDKSDDEDDESPAPIINGLREKGYHVRTLGRNTAMEEVMAVVSRDNNSPAITVAEEDCVWGLERKVVVYCDDNNGIDLGWTGRLRSFSRTTALLIYIKCF